MTRRWSLRRCARSLLIFVISPRAISAPTPLRRAIGTRITHGTHPPADRRSLAQATQPAATPCNHSRKTLTARRPPSVQCLGTLNYLPSRCSRPTGASTVPFIRLHAGTAPAAGALLRDECARTAVIAGRGASAPPDTPAGSARSTPCTSRTSRLLVGNATTGSQVLAGIGWASATHGHLTN
jgi:hypothetical protein